MRLLLSFFAGNLLLGAADPAVVSAQRSVTPGKVLWMGMPDALRVAAGSIPFDFSSDGKRLLYLQGDPWPRVMVQAIAPSPSGVLPEPSAIGDVEPFGDRTPRFDLEGRSVFFTADFTPRERDASRPFRQGPKASPGRTSPDEALRLAVVRADLGGRGVERLFPAPGAGREESAVFLDLHPVGRTILLGTATGPKSSDFVAGGFSLALSELDLGEDLKPAGPPRPLSFQVNVEALVRYSWDGTSIYYGDGPARGQPAPVTRYGRATGIHEPTGLDQYEIGWLAGDLEVSSRGLPHPGSFGWDGFRLFQLARSPEGPAVSFKPGEELAAPLPLYPVSIRGDLVLLAGGFEDRKSLAVARWDAGSFDAGLRAATLTPGSLLGDRRSLLPGFSAEEVRARGEDPLAAGLLEQIRSSQVLLAGRPLTSVRARWIQRDASPEAALERGIDATEFVTGKLYVERTQAAPNGGETPEREVLAFDGKKAWITDARGETTPLDRAALLMEAAASAPLRLLIDPAGLGFPWLSFRHAGEEVERGKDGSDRRLARLEIRSIDGFKAELRVALEEGRALPARIDSPLLFPEARTLRDLAASRTTSSVAFEDYRSEGGRLVPGRIRFDDGIHPFELILQEAEINPESAEKLFR